MVVVRTSCCKSSNAYNFSSTSGGCASSCSSNSSSSCADVDRLVLVEVPVVAVAVFAVKAECTYSRLRS